MAKKHEELSKDYLKSLKGISHSIEGAMRMLDSHQCIGAGEELFELLNRINTKIRILRGESVAQNPPAPEQLPF